MNHIGKKVGEVSHLLHHNIDALINESGISPSSAFLLRFINTQDKPVYQKDIEASFHIRRSSVTSLVQNLEKSGYIRRISDENDSRLKRLVLTEKGIEIEKTISIRIDEFETGISKMLGEERSESFMESLNLMIAYLSKERKDNKC